MVQQVRRVMGSSKTLKKMTFLCIIARFRQSKGEALAEDEAVEFTVTRGPKGLRAQNVTKL